MHLYDLLRHSLIQEFETIILYFVRERFFRIIIVIIIIIYSEEFQKYENLITQKCVSKLLYVLRSIRRVSIWYKNINKCTLQRKKH